jgi:peptidoglycan/LPS O-acetylase OafA/YrhL
LSTNTSTRIPSLDGLRTISITLVIASHLAFSFGHFNLFNAGDLGVRIFFVISGFLITGLLMAEQERTDGINLLRFYFRRTLRIFPPYYFLLFVLLLFSVLGKIHLTAVQFIPVLSYVSDYIFPDDWNIDHAWSLAVEEQFYLIFPGILVLFGLRRIKWVLAGTILVCPLLRLVDHDLFYAAHPIWLTKGFHANVDTLAVGCLLALIRPALHANRFYSRLISSRLLFVLPLLVFAINADIDYTGLDLGLLFSVNNILIAVMLDWAVTNATGAAGKFLNSAPMVTLGMMSYSIYLWQQPFLHPNPETRYFAFPFNLIGFAICVCLSYFVVERLSLRLRKRYESSVAIQQAGTLVPENAQA